MKKFLSLFLAVLISLSLLATSALAKSGGGNQSAGAPGQQESHGKPDKDNRGKGDNGKGNAGNPSKQGQKDQKDEKKKSDETRSGQGNANGQKNGNPQDEKTKNPQFFRQGNPQNVQAITDAIGKVTDSATADKLNALLAAYKNAKPGQAAQDAWTALLDALKAAGVTVETKQPVRRWWTEQQGKPIDVDAITTAIGQLTDSAAAEKLNELLTAYKEAEVGKEVHEALTALLDALKAAGIEVEVMQPPVEEGETPEEDKPLDIDAIKTAIGQLTDSATATQLNALLTAYQEAVSTGEAAIETALTALLEALKAAGITEGID